MSKSYTTNAINLTSYDFSENDKIIVMYSKEKGLLRGIAKGCKKPKSKLGAMMQSLVANKIILNKGRNLDIISQSESINSFKKLKNDFSKLSFSMYCAEIISNFGIEDDSNSDDIYNLLFTVLSTIADTKNTIEILLAVLRFQLKIMDVMGLQICIKHCSDCNCIFDENKNYKFSISSGGIICEECYKKLTNLKGKTFSIHPKIVNFLCTLEKTNFNEKTKYDELATKKICLVCFNLLKDYISYHSSKRFKTLDIIEINT